VPYAGIPPPPVVVVAPPAPPAGAPYAGIALPLVVVIATPYAGVARPPFPLDELHPPTATPSPIATAANVTDRDGSLLQNGQRVSLAFTWRRHFGQTTKSSMGNPPR
jgi:uncharacterized RDD family membrane protein YckC